MADTPTEEHQDVDAPTEENQEVDESTGTNQRVSFSRHKSANHVTSDEQFTNQAAKLKKGKKKRRLKSVILGNMKISNEEFTYKEIFCGDVLLAEHLVATGFSDGVIIINNIKNGHHLATLDHDRQEYPRLPVTSVHFTEDDRTFLLASYASGYTTLWDYSVCEPVWEIHEDRQTFVNGWNSTKTSFALAGSDAKITLYDTETKELINTFERDLNEEFCGGHIKSIFALKFHPSNNQQFVTGGWDNTVQVWDIREKQSLLFIDGPHICGNGIDFMKDGNELITASWSEENPLQTWDCRTVHLIENISLGNDTSHLYTCRYSEAGNVILIGGGNNNMLKILDSKTKQMIATYKNLPDAVIFAHEIPFHLNESQENLFRICIGYGPHFTVLELVA